MGLLGLAFNFISDSVAKQIIKEALLEAFDTMEMMLSNEGQTSIYDSYIKARFTLNSQASPEDGWEDVDAGEYIDFMGEIVEAGNQIMENAYDYAAEVNAEFSDSYDA